MCDDVNMDEAIKEAIAFKLCSKSWNPQSIPSKKKSKQNDLGHQPALEWALFLSQFWVITLFYLVMYERQRHTLTPSHKRAVDLSFSRVCMISLFFYIHGHEAKADFKNKLNIWYK